MPATDKETGPDGWKVPEWELTELAWQMVIDLVRDRYGPAPTPNGVSDCDRLFGTVPTTIASVSAHYEHYAPPNSTDGERTATLRVWGATHAMLVVRSQRSGPAEVLSDDEIAAFHQLIAQSMASWVAAWKILVAAGLDPVACVSTVVMWHSGRCELPNGQWLPFPEGAGHGRMVMPDGAIIPEGLFNEIKNFGNEIGQKIAAIKRYRQIVQCGLAEAKRTVEAIFAGYDPRRLAELPAVERPERTVARALVDVAIDGLLLVLPVHWILLSDTVICEDPSHATMAVGVSISGQVHLFYNPEFVLRISGEERMGVLVHEINHVIFGHLDLPTHRPQFDRGAWALACECTANEYVPFPLPGKCITIELFDFPPHESTFSRYQRLQKLGPWRGADLADRDILRTRLQPDATRHTDLASGDSRDPGHLVRHAVDAVGGELDEATRHALATSNRAGELGFTVDPLGVSQLPWNTLLNESVAAVPMRFATRTWPNRRQPDRIGIVPGKRTRRDEVRVLAVIDTSASMSLFELGQISDELMAMASGRVHITLVQCDTEIREVRPLLPGQPVTKMLGGGGTDFRPPFHAAFLSKYRPEVVVYFTDGEGPAPDTQPAGTKVLWILTGDNPVRPAEWGRIVALRPANRRRPVRFPP